MKFRQELFKFIESYCLNRKIRNIDLQLLNIQSSIDLDLNIFDLELDLFMSEFILHFNLDRDVLQWGQELIYPSEDDMNIAYVLCRNLDYKLPIVKRICRKLYTPKLFVYNLLSILDNPLAQC